MENKVHNSRKKSNFVVGFTEKIYERLVIQTSLFGELYG